MDHFVYVDPSLKKGSLLRKAVFVKELNRSWVLQSENPKTGNIDEYEQLEKDAVLTMYPELAELFSMELDSTVSFLKGVQSGKWYDFH